MILPFTQSPTPAVQAPTNLSEASPTNEAFLRTIGRKKLLEAQYGCYDRIQELPPYEGEGKRSHVNLYVKHLRAFLPKVYSDG